MAEQIDNFHERRNGYRNSGEAKRRSQPRPVRQTTAGTSLVEVLVVLVIILLGVFTVIQIFPIGFGTLRATGNRSFANRLAQQEIERVRSESANLPQGVLFSVFDANGVPGVSFVKNEDPDNLAPYDPSFTNANNPYFADVNKFRYIKGEPIKVPLPTTNAYGSGSVYTLKYGPIYMDQAVGNPNSVPDASTIGQFNSYLRVAGGPMTAYPVESNNGTESTRNAGRFLRTPQSYAIDYGEDNGAAYILFSPSPRDRIFTITYTYSTNDASDTATGGSTISTEITIPANEFVWRLVPGLPSGASMDPRSETVQRNFERVAATANWDTGDPYQYKLISANLGQSGLNASFANFGVVAFNPSGATYSEQTPYGQQAFTAYVDYAVLDWHILRDDREVPSVFADASGAVPVRTTVPGIKRYNTEEYDGKTKYPGLFRDTNINADIEVFDLQNGHLQSGGGYVPGEPLDAGDYKLRTGADANKDYWINYEGRQGTYPSGTIYINTNRVRPGSQLRILYKAEGDWAVSVQKAYSAYRVSINSANNGIDTRPSGFDAYGQQGTRLHFGLGDLNKSMSATFEYYKPAGSLARGESPLARVGPYQFTADQITDDGVDANGARLRYASADIRRLMPGLDTTARPGTAFPEGWRVVGDVQGVSLKTRVIWRDNDSFKNSWRIQDLDTYITRSPDPAAQ